MKTHDHSLQQKERKNARSQSTDRRPTPQQQQPPVVTTSKSNKKQRFSLVTATNYRANNDNQLLI
jgi:hypothetical protein